MNSENSPSNEIVEEFKSQAKENKFQKGTSPNNHRREISKENIHSEIQPPKEFDKEGYSKKMDTREEEIRERLNKEKIQVETENQEKSHNKKTSSILKSGGKILLKGVSGAVGLGLTAYEIYENVTEISNKFKKDRKKNLQKAQQSRELIEKEVDDQKIQPSLEQTKPTSQKKISNKMRQLKSSPKNSKNLLRSIKKNPPTKNR